MTKLLACLRNTDQTNLILASDDEGALRNAIRFAFPNSQTVVCTHQLEKISMTTWQTDKAWTNKNELQLQSNRRIK